MTSCRFRAEYWKKPRGGRSPTVAQPSGAFNLPWFDPTGARVPGIVIQGQVDQNAPQSDAVQLAAEYGSAGGGAAGCVFIAGALQLPYLEAPPHNSEFWDTVLAFLDSVEDIPAPGR